MIDPLMLNDNGEPSPAAETYEAIRTELQEFSDELARKREIVVFTKADTIPDESEELVAAEEYFKERGIRTCLISSVTGLGLEPLKEEIRKELRQLGEASEQE